MFRFIVNNGRLMKMLCGESSFCFKDALKRSARSFYKDHMLHSSFSQRDGIDRARPRLTYQLDRVGISNVRDFGKDEKQAQGTECMYSHDSRATAFVSTEGSILH